MRLVLDTNILVGALITTGTPPDRLYQAWLRGDIELVTSTAQIAEITDVLARPRLQKFLDADEAAIIVQNIGALALVLDEPPGVNLSPDSKDNPILAAAVAGKANLIVSGDKRHMLALGKVEGIPVVTARDGPGANQSLVYSFGLILIRVIEVPFEILRGGATGSRDARRRPSSDGAITASESSMLTGIMRHDRTRFSAAVPRLFRGGRGNSRKPRVAVTRRLSAR